MPCGARLAAHLHAAPELRRARQAHLRGQEGMRTDLAVVTDHDQVVELRAAADDGRAERDALVHSAAQRQPESDTLTRVRFTYARGVRWVVTHRPLLRNSGIAILVFVLAFFFKARTRG